MARILIVEDEERIASFVSKGLAADGHRTMTVTDGRDGLDQALSGDFDLMVLDIGLPGLDGFEVLDQLPVSQTDDVTVKTIAVSSGLSTEEGDSPGLLRWRLPVEPGQTASATLEFSVTAPAEAAGSYLREMELMM